MHLILGGSLKGASSIRWRPPAGLVRAAILIGPAGRVARSLRAASRAVGERATPFVVLPDLEAAVAYAAGAALPGDVCCSARLRELDQYRVSSIVALTSRSWSRPWSRVVTAPCGSGSAGRQPRGRPRSRKAARLRRVRASRRKSAASDRAAELPRRTGPRAASASSAGGAAPRSAAARPGAEQAKAERRRGGAGERRSPTRRAPGVVERRVLLVTRACCCSTARHGLQRLDCQGLFAYGSSWY